MPAALTPEQLQQYDEVGFVVLRSAFSAARVASLRDAVQRLAERAAFDDSLGVGFLDPDGEKKFPSRTGNLLDPQKYDPAYVEWLAADLVPQIDSLINFGAGPAGPAGTSYARHSLFGMLAGGAGVPYRQRWHRDVRAIQGEGDEGAFLRTMHGKSVQLNAPLVPGDAFLNVVPRSHRRSSTPEELAVAAAEDEDADAPMPGATIVRLEPGDIVYYNACLYHRGWNPEGARRWTMHCAFWDARYPVMAHEQGQREGLLTPGHIERMPAAAQRYIRRYVDNYPVDPASHDFVTVVRDPATFMCSQAHLATDPLGKPKPPVLLEPQQVRFFETFGYCVLKGVLADEIGWIRREFEDVWATTGLGAEHDGSKTDVQTAPTHPAPRPAHTHTCVDAEAS